MYVRYCKTAPWLAEIQKPLNPLMWSILQEDWIIYKRAKEESLQAQKENEAEEIENSTPTEEELMMIKAMEAHEQAT